MQTSGRSFCLCRLIMHTLAIARRWLCSGGQTGQRRFLMKVEFLIDIRALFANNGGIASVHQRKWASPPQQEPCMVRCLIPSFRNKSRTHHSLSLFYLNSEGVNSFHCALCYLYRLSSHCSGHLGWRTSSHQVMQYCSCDLVPH